jgi:hypothetical protein
VSHSANAIIAVAGHWGDSYGFCTGVIRLGVEAGTAVDHHLEGLAVQLSHDERAWAGEVPDHKGNTFFVGMRLLFTGDNPNQ